MEVKRKGQNSKKQISFKFGKKEKILVLSMVVVFLLFLYPIIEINGGFASSGNKDITVLSGETFDKITEKLKEKDVISSPLLFKIYSRLCFREESENIKSGIFHIKGNPGYKEIYKILTSEPDYNAISVTVPEGYNIEEMAELFQSKGLCDKDRFIKAARNARFDFKYMRELKDTENKLEGFLFPDTYTFDKNKTDELVIINKMLDRFTEIYEKYEKNNSGYSHYEIITLASIIEKEAMAADDFYNVSSVFHNRLKRNDYMNRLQSCATVQYILKERKTVLSDSDIKIDSPYNTYLYPGLPVGPISSPGERAIDAAINPNKTNYLYFLNDENGKLYFSETLDQHNENKRKYVN